VLSRLDGGMLETSCRTYELWLAHDGGRGYPALTSVLGKLARDLGLAPGVRQRMERPAPDPAEEAAIFGLL
jgi:phage terminase small subunit